MRARQLAALASALVIALALLWLSRRDQAGPHMNPGDGVPGAVETTRSTSPGATEPVRSTFRPKPTAPDRESAARNSTSPFSVELDPGSSFSAWVAELRTFSKTARAEDFEQRRREARQGDAESAFWLYQFFRACRNAPKAAWQYANHLESLDDNIVRELERGQSSPDRWAEDSFEYLERAYQLCRILEPDDDVVAAELEWLELAADLGHMGAQRLYHARARELLVTFMQPPLLFRRPGYLGEFQDRADRYARNLLNATHPQGLLLMARMLMIGDVYREDPLLAYAYARAAELHFGAPIQEEARVRIDWIAGQLPPDQYAAGDRMARKLLRDWGY